MVICRCWHLEIRINKISLENDIVSKKSCFAEVDRSRENLHLDMVGIMSFCGRKIEKNSTCGIKVGVVNCT